MNNKAAARIFSLALLCCVGFCAMPTAHANTYVVAPRFIDLTVEPRDIIEEKILVTNGGAPVSLFTVVNEVTVGIEGGLKEFVTPSMSDRSSTLTSWIEISRAGFDLAPGASRELPLVIRVNPSAEPGEYHAMIAFAPGTTIDDAMQRVKQGDVPSVLINVTIEKKSNDFVNLARFSIKKFVTAFHDGDVQYRVDNTGDTELIPSGDIIIYNQRGEEVATVPVNADAKSVRPGDTVTFSGGVPIEGLLGKYKAFLTLRYGSEQAAVYDTVYFYVFPWKKIGIIFVIFAVLAIACALWIHRRYSQDEDDDGAHELPVRVRESASVAHERDVIMRPK